MQTIRGIWLLTMLVVACSYAECAAEPSGRSSPDKARADRVIAIDVLLEPDATMDKEAAAVNARLRENYPKGYTLGPAQVAHITLVHRYVREQDLPAIEAAVAKVAASEQPLARELTATGIEYGKWAGVAVTTIVVERTPELSRLQEEIVKAVEPFAISGGTAEAFSTSRQLPKIDEEILNYVEKFVPNASGEKYNPHVTVGVAHEDFVKQLKAEPFEKFSFKSARVAIYQLGNFGTAQKKLWEWDARESAQKQK